MKKFIPKVEVLFAVFLTMLVTNISAQTTPSIRTDFGLGTYGYLEKDATTYVQLNSQTYGNIYQMFTRTYLNGSNIITYPAAAPNTCSVNSNIQTKDYNFGMVAMAGQIAFTSVHTDYCGGSNSYGGNTNQAGFNERQHFIFDISDRPSDLSSVINPVTGNNSVVMSVKIDFGTVADRVLQKFWIQNSGSMAESSDIANDGFKLYYEPATGFEAFDGTESTATIYGDYNSTSTSNNTYGNDNLNIAIPAGGVRIYIVLNKFNTTNLAGKSVRVSLINDNLTFTPKMNSNFELARVNQTPALPTLITVPIDYFWNGSVDSTWGNSGNWTPNGIPTATDNVTINIPGNNILNLPSGKTINNFSLNGTGTFALTSSTGALVINGNVTYGGSATANLDCASSIKITNNNLQTIPPLNYGNLNVLGGNRVLPNGGTVGICSAFTVDSSLYTYTVTGSTVNYFSSASGWILPSFTYNNLTFSGSGSYSIGKSSPAVDKISNVLGNFLQSNGSVFLGDTSSNIATLNIDGNATFTSGIFKINTTSGGTGNFNLKGNLSVGNAASLFADNNTANFNFNGNSMVQTLSIASPTTSKVNFTVKSGASVKLINQDLALGTSSKFTVENAGTFDFGFSSGNNALNIVQAPNQTQQVFELKDGGNLRITSPDGISNTINLGNVQIPVSGRTYASGVNTNYYYIGKSDQVTGNGLPTSSNLVSAPSRNVIVAMDNNALTLKPTGVQRFNSFATLEIQKGIVDDEPGNNFANSGITTEKGNLKMSGGRYLLNTSSTQPDLDGNFSLTGGVIEYKNSVTNQTIKNKAYLNIEVTGNKVGNSGGNITLLDTGTFTVKNAGEFTINANSIVGPVGTQTVKVENGGLFRTGDARGFSGSNLTSIQPSVENVILEDGSTVEYSRADNQFITGFKPLLADESNINSGGYYNLNLTGDNITSSTAKTIETTASPVYVRNNLKIGNTSTLKIEANKALIIKENIINNGSMLIESDGNLIQKDDLATFTGNDITAKRNITLSAIRQQYNYLISPLENQNLSAIYKDSSGNSVAVPFVLYYNEATSKFYTSSGIYVKGRALAVKEPTTATYSAGTIDATFVGKPGNGYVNFNIINSNISDTNRGFNLVGNPYPSNIDLVSLYNLNGAATGNLDSTFYFWDNNANNQTVQLGNQYGGQAYAQFNAVSGIGAAATGDPGFLSIKTPVSLVKTGQGFMVKSKVANTNLIFNNITRTVKTGTINFFGRNAGEITPGLNRYWLNLISPQKIVCNIAVAYFATGDNGYSSDDSPSMGGSDAIYSIVDNKNVSINGRGVFFDKDVIPLGSQHFISGKYTIMLGEKEGVFASGQNIYLKDNQLDTITNLSVNGYVFDADAGTSAGRFEILYRTELLLKSDESTKKELVVYRSQNKFVVRSTGEKITKVEVYDVSGKLHKSLDTFSPEVEIDDTDLPFGVYILKVIRNNSIVSTKVLKN